MLRTLILALCMAGLSLAQQKCPIDGTAKDQAGQGIASVKITIKSSLASQSATTDKQGKYSTTVLCTETSKHTVTASKAGYTFSPAQSPWEKYSAGPNFTGRKTSQQK